MRVSFTLAAAAAAFLSGCQAAPAPPEEPMRLAVDVTADTGRSERWRLDTAFAAPRAPEAAVWLARVSPSRPAAEPPLPEPEPAAPALELTPEPGLAIDPDLKPPILREPAPLRAPRGARGAVHLDVRVDEEGRVSDAEWAGGASDSTLVGAAIACALQMRFYPALRAGTPIAVWCRQRFDFGERTRRPRRRAAAQAPRFRRAQARRVRTASKPSER